MPMSIETVRRQRAVACAKLTDGLRLLKAEREALRAMESQRTPAGKKGQSRRFGTYRVERATQEEG